MFNYVGVVTTTLLMNVILAKELLSCVNRFYTYTNCIYSVLMFLSSITTMFQILYQLFALSILFYTVVLPTSQNLTRLKFIVRSNNYHCTVLLMQKSKDSTECVNTLNRNLLTSLKNMQFIYLTNIEFLLCCNYKLYLEQV